MAHSTRLAVLVAVALAWLVVGEASAHEVLGTIYNSSNLYALLLLLMARAIVVHSLFSHEMRACL